MANASLERLVALVRRELGADSVRVLEAEDGEALADNVLYAKLPDGRRLAVVFAVAPAKREALVRRLAILTATFAQSLEHGTSTHFRPAVARSLQEELRALAVRAHAADAAVIDAHSPIVWGAASAEAKKAPPEEFSFVDLSSARLTLGEPPQDDPAPSADPSSVGGVASADTAEKGTEDAPDVAGVRALTERAIDVARELPGLDALRKGGHVAHTVRDADLGMMVRSFASIYLLVLVYDGPYDELRAERAIEDGLPRVERLVLALPPLDPNPSPIAGVISIRRGRRR